MTEPLATPFLESANKGALSAQQCTACGRNQLPPKARCQRCGGVAMRWLRLSGRGALVSYAVLHRGPTAEFGQRVPYVYGVVELEEGPRIVTNILADPATLSVGQVVGAVFVRSDDEGQRWPEFEPER